MSVVRWYGVDLERTEAHKVRMRVSALARYYRLKNNGLCPECLVEKPKDEHVYCANCLDARKREAKA